MISINEQSFNAALRRYGKMMNKDVPTVLNHTATQAAFRAQRAGYTPQASLTGTLGTTADPGRSRPKWRYENKIYFALAAKKGIPGRAGAMQLYRKGRQSRGFIRANFGNIINELGQRRALRQAHRSDVKVRRATQGRHAVTIANARLEGEGGEKALQKLELGWRRAIHDAVWGKNGLVQFTERRIKQNWKKAG